ncbi:MAG: hypothetical protein ACTSPE_09345 [Candidatus Thorarchaeota archaeon]
MVKMTDGAFEGKHDIIDRLLNTPPRGYVFLVTATQDSHYDLFMLTLIREAISQRLSTLQIITEARNRAVMKDLASLQSDKFRILEVSYGQETFGNHTCSPHLHEINIMMRELRSVYCPQIVTFEGLTPLLIDFTPRDVVLFFKESVEESVKTGSVEFYLIHENTADPITMNQLYSLAHGIVSLTTSRGKHYMIIRKSLGIELPYNPIEYVPIMPSEDRASWQIMLNW